nr:FxFamide [Urechis unicinctus]
MASCVKIVSHLVSCNNPTALLFLSLMVITVAYSQPDIQDLSRSWPTKGDEDENLSRAFFDSYADLLHSLAKRTYEYGKLNRRALHLSDYALSGQPAWNKQFMFGKRSVSDDESGNAVFYGEPGANPHLLDNPDKRVKFKFGKRATVDDIDSMNSLMELENVSDEIQKRKKFKFGKRSLEEDLPELMLEGKRLFKFGKKSDESESKRLFKFGKKSVDNFETIENPENKRIFKFGKKSSDGYDEQDAADNKRMFKFGKKSEDGFEIFENPDNKRLFKFGKKSSGDATGMEEPQIKKLFKFGKKSSDNYGDIDISDEKRKFMFGKRSVDQTDSLDEEKRRIFQFGKKSSPYEEDKRAKFMFGKRMDTTDDSYIAEKRPYFQFGKRFDGIDEDKRGPRFTFGKRDEESEYTKRAKFMFGKRRKFMFGKRDEDQMETYSSPVEDSKRMYHPVPYSFTMPGKPMHTSGGMHTMQARPRGSIKTFHFGKRLAESDTEQSTDAQPETGSSSNQAQRR